MKELLEKIRQLIGNNQIQEAFLLTKNIDLTRDFLDDLILLENQFNHWEHSSRINIGATDARRNRITYGFLATLSKIEESFHKSIKTRQQYEIEALLEGKYQKIAKLEEPSNRTETILKTLEKHSPTRYDQLKNLSIQLKKNHDLPKNIDAIVQFFGRQLSSIENITESDVNLLTQALINQPEMVLIILNEKRHKEASIKLLEKQIEDLKVKYEKIKIAGLASLLGAFVSALIFKKSDESVFGKKYNSDGYDLNGYDPDGFNESGFSKNGSHFLGKESLPEDYKYSAMDQNDDFDDDTDD